MIKFLDLNSQYASIRDEVDAAVTQVLSTCSFIGGEALEKFERSFAQYQGVDHCIGVGNGTDAIEIALEALDLKCGSEIIVPANSFIATSEAVTRAGHKVIFADICPATYTLDVDDVAKRITPETAALVPVHLYGQPCSMDELLRLASRYGLKVIEDAAQAHGAEIEGRRVGGFGDVATFSFYPGKNLGGYGDGGAILTNNTELARKCKMIANHGRLSKYDHEFEGRNSRLDTLQAAILDVKLAHLDEWIEARRAVAAIYVGQLQGVGDLVLPELSPRTRHVFHLFVVRTSKRDELAAFLSDREIGTGIHYPIALPKLKAYAHLGLADAPLTANRQDSQLLSLPMGEHLSRHEVDQIVSAIKVFFAQEERG